MLLILSIHYHILFNIIHSHKTLSYIEIYLDLFGFLWIMSRQFYLVVFVYSYFCPISKAEWVDLVGITLFLLDCSEMSCGSICLVLVVIWKRCVCGDVAHLFLEMTTEIIWGTDPEMKPQKLIEHAKPTQIMTFFLSLFCFTWRTSQISLK